MDMRIHQVASKIYHTYKSEMSKSRLSAVFLGSFGDFWAQEQNLHSKISNFDFLSVSFDCFAWNHIVSHRYWWDWVFRTIFTTLRALLKSGLSATQLYIRSDTSSYAAASVDAQMCKIKQSRTLLCLFLRINVILVLAQNGETNLFRPQWLLVADVAAKATGGKKFNCDNIIQNV